MKQATSQLALTIAVLALATAVQAAPPSAKTRVTLGPVYEIAEPSIYEQLQALLKEKQESGEMAQLEKEGRERAERSIRNPAPVDGLRIARTKRTWTYDPSVVATADVRDNEGNLIVARGTAVSPLEQVSWKPMVFFDQRDESQVRMAKQLMEQWKGRGKAVLVAGNWMDLSKAWGHQVYFDQKGTLIQKFGINAVPATVTQQGKVLLISELPITDDAGRK